MMPCCAKMPVLLNLVYIDMVHYSHQVRALFLRAGQHGRRCRGRARKRLLCLADSITPLTVSHTAVGYAHGDI